MRHVGLLDLAAQPVTNVSGHDTTSPTAKTLNANSSTSTVTKLVENGLHFHRYNQPADDTGSLWSLLQVWGIGAENFKTGETVTAIFRARASAAITATPWQIAPGNSTPILITFGPVNLTTEWQWFVRTGVARVDGSAAMVGYMPSIGRGNSFDIAEFGLFKGSPTSYADGDYPGWLWTGTPRLSRSIGYPYTLESIAGRPLAHFDTPNTLSTGLGPTEARTLYTVHEVLNLDSGYASISRFGSSGTGGISYGTGLAGSGSLRTRFDTVGGQTNGVLSFSGTRTVGRHIIATSLNEGISQATMQVDAQPAISGAILPGTVNDVIQLVAPTVSDIAVALVAYRGEHNAQTRERVMAWLARRYNVSFAPTNLDGGVSSDTAFAFTADGGTSSATVFDYTFDGGTS